MVSLTALAESKLKDTTIAEFLLTAVLDIESLSKKLEKEVGVDVKDLVVHVAYEVVLELLREGNTDITVSNTVDMHKKVRLTTTYYVK